MGNAQTDTYLEAFARGADFYDLLKIKHEENMRRAAKTDANQAEAIAYLLDLERRLANRRSGWRPKRGGRREDRR
jgi:hypothetical protein